MKKGNVLVLGANGMTGAILCRKLLGLGYNVIGTIRRSSTNNLERLRLIKDQITLEEMDITDPYNVYDIFTKYKPELAFNTIAQSHVHTSFNQPVNTFEVDAVGVINVLESIKRFSNHTSLVHYSTSEMFGRNFSIVDGKKVQNEQTQFQPQSPYAIAKVAAHEMVGLYRRSYNLKASCIICFNKEHYTRGENFVTRKITKWIGYAVNELNHNRTPDKLKLGNIDSFRDWGWAEDYADAAIMIAKDVLSDDYVVATGETHSVYEFLHSAMFSSDYYSSTNVYPEITKYVEVQSPDFIRPAEVDYLCGDYTKIYNKLGWKPKTTLTEIIDMMVKYDIEKAKTP